MIIPSKGGRDSPIDDNTLTFRVPLYHMGGGDSPIDQAYTTISSYLGVHCTIGGGGGLTYRPGVYDTILIFRGPIVSYGGGEGGLTYRPGIHDNIFESKAQLGHQVPDHNVYSVGLLLRQGQTL